MSQVSAASTSLQELVKQQITSSKWSESAANDIETISLASREESNVLALYSQDLIAPLLNNILFTFYPLLERNTTLDHVYTEGCLSCFRILSNCFSYASENHILDEELDHDFVSALIRFTRSSLENGLQSEPLLARFASIAIYSIFSSSDSMTTKLLKSDGMTQICLLCQEFPSFLNQFSLTIITDCLLKGWPNMNDEKLTDEDSRFFRGLVLPFFSPLLKISEEFSEDDISCLLRFLKALALKSEFNPLLCNLQAMQILENTSQETTENISFIISQITFDSPASDAEDFDKVLDKTYAWAVGTNLCLKEGALLCLANNCKIPKVNEFLLSSDMLIKACSNIGNQLNKEIAFASAGFLRNFISTNSESKLTNINLLYEVVEKLLKSVESSSVNMGCIISKLITENLSVDKQKCLLSCVKPFFYQEATRKEAGRALMKLYKHILDMQNPEQSHLDEFMKLVEEIITGKLHDQVFADCVYVISNLSVKSETLQNYFQAHLSEQFWIALDLSLSSDEMLAEWKHNITVLQKILKR